MEISIFTKKDTALKEIFPKNTQFFPLSEIAQLSAQNAELSYIDISGFTADELNKTLTKIKKLCANINWGIIDLKGTIKDPASLFFDGACDYIGSSFLKSVDKIDPKRLKRAVMRQTESNTQNAENKPALNSFNKTAVKFPAANTFTGWKNITPGKTMPFFLLYCSLQGKDPLDTRFDDKALDQIYKRFAVCLNKYFDDCECIKWMDSGKDCLYLVPPAKCVAGVIEACLRMIICAPMITFETLSSKIPINFVFALHYGSLNYKPPGKTGNIVSEAVNSIFHLGSKKAEPGRITITDELPSGSIPKSLEDCFVPAGAYEGRNLLHTKKFTYEKLWV